MSSYKRVQKRINERNAAGAILVTGCAGRDAVDVLCTSPVPAAGQDVCASSSGESIPAGPVATPPPWHWHHVRRLTATFCSNVPETIPCAECGVSCKGRGPFCGDYCNAVAKFVRLCRRWLREAAAHDDPDYPHAMQVQLAFLNTAYLAHGRVYNKKARYLSDARKAAIRERDHGQCVRCGKPGVEIDHIAGSSSDPSNLQLLCLDCHHAKTRSNMRAITDSAERAALVVLHAELAQRIEASVPHRACDNEQTWSKGWRSWPNMPAAAMAYQQQVTARTFVDIIAAVRIRSPSVNEDPPRRGPAKRAR